MKKTKRRLEMYSFFNYDGLCRHLEKMAAKGWLIDKVTNLGWIYRKVEPMKVTFAISYYPKASEFDPEPTEGQKRFIEFCEHTGWKLACTSAQAQMFYNEQENPTPIETEPALEVEAIHASVKKSYLPAQFMLMLIGLMQVGMLISGILGDPISVFSNSSRLVSGTCFMFVILLTVVDVSCYFYWHSKAKKAAEMGEFVKAVDTSLFQKIVVTMVFLVFGYWLIDMMLSGDPVRRWLTVAMLIYMPLLFALVNGTKELLKRIKASKGVNRTLTIVTSFVLSFAMMGLITGGTLWASNRGLFAAKDEETYEHRGSTLVIYQDELPLTIEDLMEVDYDGYIKERRGNETLFLGEFDMTQRPRFDAENYAQLPWMEYEMVFVKWQALYDTCKHYLLYEQRFMERGELEYRLVDAAPWGAKEAYLLYDEFDGSRNQYLLCYEDTLVEINFAWELTEEQKVIVGEKLGV